MRGPRIGPTSLFGGSPPSQASTKAYTVVLTPLHHGRRGLLHRLSPSRPSSPASAMPGLDKMVPQTR